MFQSVGELFCFGLVLLTSFWFIYSFRIAKKREEKRSAPKKKLETQAAKLVGDVSVVLSGAIEPEKAKREKFFFGLGAASFGENLEDIGEFIALNGKYYIKSVKLEGYPTGSGANVLPSFGMGLSTQGPKPRSCESVPSKLSLADFYQEKIVTEKLDFFAVVAIGEFENVSTTAIKESPIYYETLTDNKEKYFHPVSVIPCAKAVIFGLVMKNELIKDPEYATKTKKMFYVNFADKKATEYAYQSHTHIALFDSDEFDDEKVEKVLDETKMLELVDENVVTDVQHLLNATRFVNAKVMIYDLAGINCTEL